MTYKNGTILMNMMNKLMLAAAVSGLLAGCITSKEIIVGRDENGNEIVRKADDIDYDKAAQARINLAYSFMQQREMSSAKENLNIAESYSSGLEALHLAWGRYYDIVGDYTNAEKKYQRAISENPESGISYTHYGNFLCSRGRRDEGLNNLLKAVSLPKFAQMSLAYETAATCAYEAGKTEDSRKYFEQAMSYGGNSPSLLFNYAMFSFENGDYEKADKLMRNYDMFQHRDTAQTLFLKIRIAQKMGEYASSEIFGRKLLKAFPKSDEAKKFKAGEY